MIALSDRFYVLLPLLEPIPAHVHSKSTCQLIGIMISPAADFAHRTPSSFSAVLKKYCVESPKDITRARMMSPGRRDFTTSALSTSVARISC